MFRLFYRFFFYLTSWKIDGTFPADIKKYIAAFAPHTSNMDFVYGVMARSLTRITKGRFLGKSELFKAPYGWFFRLMGGYPVNRSYRGGDMVQHVVDIIHAHDEFILAIAPEGTRKKVERLKTGFYYIALKADIPIVPCGLDYSRKAVVIGEPFYPTGDIDVDMEQLMKFFRSLTGYNPEQGL